MEYLLVAGGGKIAAVNPSSGNIKWETHLKGSFKLTGEVTLLIEKDLIYASCQGYLFCVDRHNGDIKWHNGLKGFGLGNMVIAFNGKISGIRHDTSGYDHSTNAM